MSAPITVEIDCLATARRILSAPDAVYSATAFEVVAMAACTVRESTGKMPDLPVVADPPTPSASLSSAVARLVRANGVLRDERCSAYSAILALGEDGDASLADAVDEFNAALAALQTRFEKEFPNGSDL